VAAKFLNQSLSLDLNPKVDSLPDVIQTRAGTLAAQQLEQTWPETLAETDL
jgi:hypothetical protein